MQGGYLLLLVHTAAFEICYPALKPNLVPLGSWNCVHVTNTLTAHPALVHAAIVTFILCARHDNFFTSSEPLESQRCIFVHIYDLKESSTRTLAGLHEHLPNIINFSFAYKSLSIKSNVHNIALSQMKETQRVHPTKGASSHPSKPPPPKAPPEPHCATLPARCRGTGEATDQGQLGYSRCFYTKGAPTQQQLLSGQGFNPRDHLKNKVRPSPGHQL